MQRTGSSGSGSPVEAPSTPSARPSASMGPLSLPLPPPLSSTALAGPAGGARHPSFAPPSASLVPSPTLALPLPTALSVPSAGSDFSSSRSSDPTGLAELSLSWTALSSGAGDDAVLSDALPGAAAGLGEGDGGDAYSLLCIRNEGERLQERGSLGERPSVPYILRLAADGRYSAPGGTDTVTTVVTITTQAALQGERTLADPLCRSNFVPVDDGALTVSVFAGGCRAKVRSLADDKPGPYTTITLFPQTYPWTVHPTTTRFATSTITEVSVTYATATATETRYSTRATTTQLLPTPPPTTTSGRSSSVSQATNTSSIMSSSPTATRSSASQCLPGDSQQKEEGGLFAPTPSHVVTLCELASVSSRYRSSRCSSRCYCDLYAPLVGYLLFLLTPACEPDIVGITICWNILFIRALLYPFKSLVVAYHEFGWVTNHELLSHRCVLMRSNLTGTFLGS